MAFNGIIHEKWPQFSLNNNHDTMQRNALNVYSSPSTTDTMGRNSANVYVLSVTYNVDGEKQNNRSNKKPEKYTLVKLFSMAAISSFLTYKHRF